MKNKKDHSALMQKLGSQKKPIIVIVALVIIAFGIVSLTGNGAKELNPAAGEAPKEEIIASNASQEDDETKKSLEECRTELQKMEAEKSQEPKCEEGDSKEVESTKKELEEAKKELEEVKTKLEENEKKIEEDKKILEESKQAVEENKKMEEEHKKELEEKDKMLEEKDQALKEAETTASDLQATVNESRLELTSIKFGGADYYGKAQLEVEKASKEIQEAIEDEGELDLF